MDEQPRLRTLALLSFAVRVSAFSRAGNDNTGGDGGILCAILPGTVRERPAGSHLEEVRLVDPPPKSEIGRCLAKQSTQVEVSGNESSVGG